MSWFGLGGGGNKDNDEESSSGSSGDSFADQGSSFEAGRGMEMGASGGGMDVGGGGAALGGRGSFEQDLVMEQQKAMVQAVMARLTEMSFDQCVSKPSASLSSSEKSCIQAVTNKYLDASEFTVARFSQGQQQR